MFGFLLKFEWWEWLGGVIGFLVMLIPFGELINNQLEKIKRDKTLKYKEKLSVISNLENIEIRIEEEYITRVYFGLDTDMTFEGKEIKKLVMEVEGKSEGDDYGNYNTIIGSFSEGNLKDGLLDVDNIVREIVRKMVEEIEKLNNNKGVWIGREYPIKESIKKGGYSYDIQEYIRTKLEEELKSKGINGEVLVGDVEFLAWQLKNGRLFG